jgi:hypothetical protein
MKWGEKELTFILYNNRSVSGVVKNFIPKLNPFSLSKLEQRVKEVKSKFNFDSRTVSVKKDEFDYSAEDIIVTPEDIQNLSEMFLKLSCQFSESELMYLMKRGLKFSDMNRWNLFGLSKISDKRHLDIIGASIHPLLNSILQNSQNGIIIPLFDDNKKLINCAIRRIDIENDGELKTLKYSLACPDVHIWGLDNISKGDEIWLTEGILDTIAISKFLKKSVSVSSPNWSAIQLIQLIKKSPSKVNIFSDNDKIGIINSFIIREVLNLYDIRCDVYISDCAKDASEHIFSKGRDLQNLIKIEDYNEFVNLEWDNDFDLVEHIKNRGVN